MARQGPAQWDLKRLKHIASIEGGQSPKGDDVGLLADDFDAPPFLQGNAEFSNYNPVPRLFCYVAKRKCIEGDILLSVRAPVSCAQRSRSAIRNRPRPRGD